MIEAQIDEFLDAISESSILFKKAILSFIEKNSSKLEDQLGSIAELEKKADTLRREIENYLYTHSLIPENRGDVLGLLESMDNVIDTAKNTVTNFNLENPDIPEELTQDFIDLAEHSAMAAESIVLAARSFFRDVKTVKDHLHKVHFYEREADKIAFRLKREIFTLKIELSRRIHLTNFVQHTDFVADRAQAVADRLAIYAIKRTV